MDNFSKYASGRAHKWSHYFLFAEKLFFWLKPTNSESEISLFFWPTLPTHSTTSPLLISLFLVPTLLASKFIWQVLSDLGSDHLSISITIFISPVNNSTFCPPLFNYITACWVKYLPYINTHCPPPLIVTTFSLSEATNTFTKLVNVDTLPLLLATSTVLLKIGGLLKLQKAL